MFLTPESIMKKRLLGILALVLLLSSISLAGPYGSGIKLGGSGSTMTNLMTCGGHGC
jgi:hypothetical protein